MSAANLKIIYRDDVFDKTNWDSLEHLVDALNQTANERCSGEPFTIQVVSEEEVAASASDPAQDLLGELRHWVGRSDLSWMARYDIIFSDRGIAPRIQQAFPGFRHQSPDMDYDDDVRAYLRQFEDYLRGDRAS